MANGNDARLSLNPFCRYLRAFRRCRRALCTHFGGGYSSGVASVWRIEEQGTEQGYMPDLGAMLMRSCLGSLRPSRDGCAECRRIPLAGERIHELDSGRVLCELCFGALPEQRRHAVRSERVHAGERPLAAAPKAA